MKIWSYIGFQIRSHPFLFALNVLFYIGYFAMGPNGLIPGFMMRTVFNGLTHHPGDVVKAWGFLAGFVLLQFGGLACLYFAGILFKLQGFVDERTCVENAVTQQISGRSTFALPTGEFISRLRDDIPEIVRLTPVLSTTPQLITAVIAIVIMFRINALTSLSVLAPILFTAVLTPVLYPRMEQIKRRSFQANAAVAGFMADVCNATQAIKLANAEEKTASRLNRLYVNRRRAAVADVTFSAAMQSMNANLVAATVGIMLLLAAISVRRSEFTVGDFVLFASYLPVAITLPSFVWQAVILYGRASSSISRMEVLMDGAPDFALVRPRRAPAVASRSLPALEELTIRGLTTAGSSEGGVHDIGLKIPAGSFTIVTGRVGSGKSTLLKALVGLIPIEAGEIRWNGLAVSPFDLRPPYCAYTAQAPRLFSDTVRDNILLEWPASAEALSSALRHAVLEEDIAHFPAGLNTPVGPRGVKLSGGQMQRVAAARMFVRSNELLVVDDLSSALDARTETLLWERLRSSNLTCLAVSHRQAALERADQIVLLDHGRIAAVGSLQELLDGSALFREIWRGHDA